MTAEERFDGLVSSYLDEALDAEGMSELNGLLATRADYAARFVKLSRLHGGLREIQRREPAVAPPERRRFGVVLIAALVAAALLAGFLLIRSFRS
jgi:hypothetical protein